VAIDSGFWTGDYTDFVYPQFTSLTLADGDHDELEVNDDLDGSTIDWYYFDTIDLGSSVTFLGGKIDYDESAGDRERGRITCENSAGVKLLFAAANLGAASGGDLSTKLYDGDNNQRLLRPRSNSITFSKAWDLSRAYATPTSDMAVDTITLEVPTFFVGTPAEVAAAALLYCNDTYGTAISFEADTWDDADAGMKDQPTGLIRYLNVMYRRESGKTYGDALKKIARHSAALLAINMSGDLSLYRRVNLDSAYVVSGLTAADGVVSIKWRSAWEHLVNKAFVSWGSWHAGEKKRVWDAGGTNDEQTYYPSLSPVDAAGEDFYSHYGRYEDADSVTKYGERELGGGRVLFDTELELFGGRVIDYEAERKYFNLPLLSWSTDTGGENIRDTYMERLDQDAQLRREVTVVQDFRGLDYDVGWAVDRVAVTKDGSTIDRTRCIAKTIDFSDCTVTSVLIEDATARYYDFNSSALQGGDTTYFPLHASAAKTGAYGVRANGSNGYRVAWVDGADVAVDGCRIGVWVYCPDDGSHDFKAPGIHFAGQGSGTLGFQAVLDMRGPALSLRRDFSPSGYINSSINSAVQLDTWYWLEVVGSSTGFTATLYDDQGGNVLLTATRNDTTYTTGDVGLAIYSTGNFDDLTIYQ
jgi:hypothetical protein